MDMPLIANILGFLSLLGYCVTLLPTIIRIVFPFLQKKHIVQWFLKYRREIGILAFLFALAHGFLLAQKRNVDFFDIKTFLIYFQGICTLSIFTLLAITSNDWSVRRLKKNWKKLHQMTYYAIFILNWHVLEKMSGHWTYLTPIAIVVINVITVLLLMRFGIDKYNKNRKTKSKEAEIKLPEKTAV